MKQLPTVAALVVLVAAVCAAPVEDPERREALPAVAHVSPFIRERPDPGISSHKRGYYQGNYYVGYARAQDLKCRSCSNTSSCEIVSKYDLDSTVVIACQVAGEVIDENGMWDKTDRGCYVSDYYVQTTGKVTMPGIGMCAE